MIYKSLFVPLGVDSTPLGLKKCTALQAGAGLLGSFINHFTSQEANSMNLKMTRENNETQKLLAREANAMAQAQFDANMKWLQEQYYDTEKGRRLVETYKKAGLNPALGLGQISPVGSVGGASPSQFHVAQTEAGHIEPSQFGDLLSQSIGHSVDAYYDNKLKSEQADNVHADSLIKQAQASTEFMSRIADIRSKYADIEAKLAQKGVSEATREKLKSEKDKIDGEINLFWTQFMDMANKTKYENRVLNLQGNDIEQEVIAKKIENMYRPAQIEAGINLSNSQARSLIANLQTIAPQIALLASERKLNNSKNIAQILMNGFDALDFKDKAQLAEIYGKNGFTQKGKNFFYALGDLIMHGLNNVKVPR